MYVPPVCLCRCTCLWSEPIIGKTNRRTSIDIWKKKKNEKKWNTWHKVAVTINNNKKITPKSNLKCHTINNAYGENKTKHSHSQHKWIQKLQKCIHNVNSPRLQDQKDLYLYQTRKNLGTIEDQSSTAHNQPTNPILYRNIYTQEAKEEFHTKNITQR